MKTSSDSEVWHQVAMPDGSVIWLGWGLEKNRVLMTNPDRRISFEHVLIAMGEQGIEALYQDTRPAHRHKNQWLLEVTINGYTYLCPCKFIEGENHENGLFLKTCYPSRKATSRRQGDHPAT